MNPSSEPDDTSGEDQRHSAEDAAWQAIIDNYGERPRIDEPEAEQSEPPSWPAPRPPGREPDEEPQSLVPPSPVPEPPVPESRVPEELAEHYVPPPPPPLPKPPPARLLAWIGLFGVPMLVLVSLLAGLSLPSWLGLILMVWFVGGFVFLVASMRPGPGDYDDGARL